jgi:hypothetical protein
MISGIFRPARGRLSGIGSGNQILRRANRYLTSDIRNPTTTLNVIKYERGRSGPCPRCLSSLIEFIARKARSYRSVVVGVIAVDTKQ